jgi:hypothetical protein
MEVTLPVCRYKLQTPRTPSRVSIRGRIAHESQYALTWFWPPLGYIYALSFIYNTDRQWQWSSCCDLSAWYVPLSLQSWSIQWHCQNGFTDIYSYFGILFQKCSSKSMGLITLIASSYPRIILLQVQCDSNVSATNTHTLWLYAPTLHLYSRRCDTPPWVLSLPVQNKTSFFNYLEPKAFFDPYQCHLLLYASMACRLRQALSNCLVFILHLTLNPG